jgi:hypothetical protein
VELGKLLSPGPPGEVVACHFLEARFGPSSGWWGVSKLPARVCVGGPILRWLLFTVMGEGVEKEKHFLCSMKEIRAKT